MDFLFLLGRFHVLVLHLPIGIILAAVVLEFLARSDRYRYLNSAGPYLWCAAALTSVVTVIFGYLHFFEGGFDGPSASAHRLYGTSIAIITLLIWWLRAKVNRVYRRIQPLAALVIVGLVMMTGHYGGNLTHGSTYLMEYAPQPLRSLAGLGERRAPVTDLALADPYLDIVQPLLQERCASCHGEDKRNGEFGMETYESTLAGGETGTAVVPGNASVSELYRRVTLPQNHDAFMPAEGRTPLTDGQVEILRWWIDAGAPRQTTLAALGFPDELRAALALEAGLGDEPAAGRAASVDTGLIESLRREGFLVRQVAQGDARLSIAVSSPGSVLPSSALAALAAASDATVELNLQDSGIGDDGLQVLRDFEALTHLRLSNNAITDAGVRALAGMTQLEYLNLYGNAGITDASAAALASLPNLARVFVWQTDMSEEGIATLRRLRPDLDVQGASTLVIE